MKLFKNKIMLVIFSLYIFINTNSVIFATGNCEKKDNSAKDNCFEYNVNFSLKYLLNKNQTQNLTTEIAERMTYLFFFNKIPEISKITKYNIITERNCKVFDDFYFDKFHVEKSDVKKFNEFYDEEKVKHFKNAEIKDVEKLKKQAIPYLEEEIEKLKGKINYLNNNKNDEFILNYQKNKEKNKREKNEESILKENELSNSELIEKGKKSIEKKIFVLEKMIELYKNIIEKTKKIKETEINKVIESIKTNFENKCKTQDYKIKSFDVFFIKINKKNLYYKLILNLNLQIRYTNELKKIYSYCFLDYLFDIMKKDKSNKETQKFLEKIKGNFDEKNNESENKLGSPSISEKLIESPQKILKNYCYFKNFNFFVDANNLNVVEVYFQHDNCKDLKLITSYLNSKKFKDGLKDKIYIKFKQYIDLFLKNRKDERENFIKFLDSNKKSVEFYLEQVKQYLKSQIEEFKRKNKEKETTEEAKQINKNEIEYLNKKLKDEKTLRKKAKQVQKNFQKDYDSSIKEYDSHIQRFSNYDLKEIKILCENVNLENYDIIELRR